MAGRKKSPLQQAAKNILAEKGVDYNEWKKEVLNTRKLAIMSDEDKEWTDNTLNEEIVKLVTVHVSKSNQESSRESEVI